LGSGRSFRLCLRSGRSLRLCLRSGRSFRLCLGTSRSFRLCLGTSRSFRLCLGTSRSFRLCLGTSRSFRLCLSTSLGLCFRSQLLLRSVKSLLQRCDLRLKHLYFGFSQLHHVSGTVRSVQSLLNVRNSYTTSRNIFKRGTGIILGTLTKWRRSVIAIRLFLLQP